MFGIGTSELLIILVIVIVIFGAKRLPEIGSGLGKGIMSFKNAFKEHESLDSKSSDEKNKVQ